MFKLPGQVHEALHPLPRRLGAPHSVGPCASTISGKTAACAPCNRRTRLGTARARTYLFTGGARRYAPPATSLATLLPARLLGLLFRIALREGRRLAFSGSLQLVHPLQQAVDHVLQGGDALAQVGVLDLKPPRVVLPALALIAPHAWRHTSRMPEPRGPEVPSRSSRRTGGTERSRIRRCASEATR